MTDVHSKKIRSKNMAAIKGKNTKPEINIAEALLKRRIKFKKHAKDLPGNPDFVLKDFGAVIFVHGCFWHEHHCHLFHWPSTRKKFWKEKIHKNLLRDHRNEKLLKQDGWWILKIWECTLKGNKKMDFDVLMDRVENWIRYAKYNKSISRK